MMRNRGCMVTGQNAVFCCATNFLRGRKCKLCGSFQVLQACQGTVKCPCCGKSKRLSRLTREMDIPQGFYQLQPAYRLTQDFGADCKVVTRVYQRLREELYHLAELEGVSSRAKSNWMRCILADDAKANVGQAATGKVKSSGSLSEKI